MTRYIYSASPGLTREPFGPVSFTVRPKVDQRPLLQCGSMNTLHSAGPSLRYSAHTAGGSVAGFPDPVRALWQKARLAVCKADGLH